MDEQSFEQDQENNPPTILLSSFPFDKVTSMSAQNSFERSDISNQLRQFEKMKDVLSNSKKKHKEKIQAYHERLNQFGIYTCNEADTFGSCCMFQTTSKVALQKHRSSGVHNFPAQSIQSRVVNKLQNPNNPSVSLTLSSVQNQSDAHAPQSIEIKSPSSKLQDKEIGSRWHEPGCYAPSNNRGRTQFRKSYELKCDLELLFRQGESRESKSTKLTNANKYTPEQAWVCLSNLEDSEGR